MSAGRARGFTLIEAVLATSLLALGLALAFGLGGRDVASRLLEDAYANGQRAKQQAKDDLQTGQARAQDAADQVRSSAGGTSTYSGASAGSSTTNDSTRQFSSER